MDKKTVVVLGAGISGLSYAYYFKKFHPDKHVVILEKSAQIGGKVSSGSLDGTVMEWGPRGVRPKGRGQHVLELVESLGLWSQLVFADEKAKKRYLYYDGDLQALPNSIISIIKSPFAKLFIKALLTDLKADRFKGDESIAQFSDRHFGYEFRSLFVDSLVSGVWAGDVEKTSVLSTLTIFKELEQNYGSVFKGLIFSSKKSIDAKRYQKKYTTKALFSFKKGMGVLVDALAKKLEPNIRPNSVISKIDFDSKTIHLSEGSSIVYEKLVSTIPAYNLAPFVPKLMSDALSRIEYAPLALYNFTINKHNFNFDGFGFLVPSKEVTPVLGMVANSTTFPEHSTDALESNTLMMGGARHNLADLKSMDLSHVAESYLKRVFGADFVACNSDLRLYEKAIPQYLVGHTDLVKSINDYAPNGVVVLGNYMYGVSLIDLIVKSKEMAKNF